MATRAVMRVWITHIKLFQWAVAFIHRIEVVWRMRLLFKFDLRCNFFIYWYVTPWLSFYIIFADELWHISIMSVNNTDSRANFTWLISPTSVYSNLGVNLHEHIVLVTVAIVVWLIVYVIRISTTISILDSLELMHDLTVGRCSLSCWLKSGLSFEEEQVVCTLNRG